MHACMLAHMCVQGHESTASDLPLFDIAAVIVQVHPSMSLWATKCASVHVCVLVCYMHVHAYTRSDAQV